MRRAHAEAPAAGHLRPHTLNCGFTLPSHSLALDNDRPSDLASPSFPRHWDGGRGGHRVPPMILLVSCLFKKFQSHFWTKY